MKRILLAPLLAVGLVLTGCSDSATRPELSGASSVSTLSNDAAKPGDKTIATLAGESGLTELVGALVYVDEALEMNLVETFSNDGGQWTVFAPTNQAFEDLYGLLGGVLGVQINGITDLPAEVVRDVLLYHVVEGRRTAQSVVPKNNAKAMESLLEEYFFVQTDLSITDGLSQLEVRDDAMITAPFDVSASNGVVHVITQVIVPPSVVAALTS